MTVIRVRPSGYNTQTGDPDDTEPERLTLDHAFVAPRSSSDVNDRGRNGVIIGLSLYAPYGADVLPGDAIEVDGVEYQVEGDAGQWKSGLTGWEAGCEVAVSRAVG